MGNITEKHIDHNNGKVKGFEFVVRYLESEKDKLYKMQLETKNKPIKNINREISLSAAIRSTSNYLEYMKSKLEKQKLK